MCKVGLEHYMSCCRSATVAAALASQLTDDPTATVETIVRNLAASIANTGCLQTVCKVRRVMFAEVKKFEHSGRHPNKDVVQFLLGMGEWPQDGKARCKGTGN